MCVYKSVYTLLNHFMHLVWSQYVLYFYVVFSLLMRCPGPVDIPTPYQGHAQLLRLCERAKYTAGWVMTTLSSFISEVCVVL